MHKTSSNNETPIQTSFWSACLAMVTVFAIADVLTGGLINESFYKNTHHLEVAVAFVIATIGVGVLESPPGLKFSRACSRHKL